MAYQPLILNKAMREAVAEMNLKPGTYHGRLNGLCTVIVISRKLRGVQRTPEIITDYNRLSTAIRGAKRAAVREKLTYKGRFDL